MARYPASTAVVSDSLYRAQCLALALRRESECDAVAVISRDAVVLARYPVIVIDVDGQLAAALLLVLAITTINPEAKVILLGVVESESNVVSMAEVGASGYLPLGSSLQELISVMMSVQNGEFTCSPSITYALFSHLSQLWLRINNGGYTPEASLTIRQRQILGLLSLQLSNKEIAARLCLSEYSVKNHVHRILKKLGVRKRTLACRTTAVQNLVLAQFEI